MYADFQKKIFAEISGKMFQTFHCTNVTTMKSLELFPRNLREHFFLKISIHCDKVFTKKVPNIEVLVILNFPRVWQGSNLEKQEFLER